MNQRLTARTALVTGSTSNIGRAIATRLAAEGAHVVVSGRDEARGTGVVEEIRTTDGRTDLLVADLDGSAAASQVLASAACETLGGRIDILVNNAGIYPPSTTLTTDEELFDRVLGVNVKAAYFLTQAVVPGMTDQGGGTIVNLGSWIARLGVSGGALYAATKGALETLTRMWAAEFADRKIRVNAVSPGVIRPPHLTPDVDFAEQMMVGTPAGTVGHPDAIAAAVAYLASDDASFVHGTVIDVDGGRTGVAVIAA